MLIHTVTCADAAAQSGEQERVQEILSMCDNDACLVNAEDSQGRSALYIAAEGGHLYTVKVRCMLVAIALGSAIVILEKRSGCHEMPCGVLLNLLPLFYSFLHSQNVSMEQSLRIMLLVVWLFEKTSDIFRVQS
jgi:hypothetical protein